MAGYVIAFDIDGVLADWSHRVGNMKTDPEAFYEAMPRDPTLPGAVLWNLLANQAAMLQKAIQERQLDIDWPALDILTCRPEKMRSVTLEWFERNGLMLPRAMHMRADDDDRLHSEIKLEMYRNHYEGKEEVVGLFDDNTETVEIFRGVGVPCYQA